MAWQIISKIIDLPITKEFTSELKFTALVYANFAKMDGTDVYPSRETVAEITGYHERSIQRYQHRLVELGILIPDGKGRGGTNKYKFNLSERGDTQSPLVVEGDKGYIEGAKRGDTQSPKGDTQSPKGDTQSERGDIPSGDIPSGDTQSPKPNKPFIETEKRTINNLRPKEHDDSFSFIPVTFVPNSEEMRREVKAHLARAKADKLRTS